MTLSSGVRIGPYFLVPPKCSGCGKRLQYLPGYRKWSCPSGCHPETYKPQVQLQEEEEGALE